MENRRSTQWVLTQFLERLSRTKHDQDAIVFRNSRLTWSEYNMRVNRLANGLKNIGIGKGDKVYYIFKNCIEYLESSLAVMKIGAVGVHGNFRLGPAEHVYQISQSESSAIIFDNQYAGIVDQIRLNAGNLKHLVCVGKCDIPGAHDYNSLLENGSPELPGIYIDDDEPTIIMYTSGTTGRPKGAVMTHKNLVSACFTMVYYYPNLLETRTLIVLPLFHMAGYLIFVWTVFTGGTAILSDRTDPEEILADIQKERISSLTLVAPMWNWIIQNQNFNCYDLSSLKICITGAAVMPKNIKLQLIENVKCIKLFEGFGMTETTAVGTIADQDELLKKPGTVGRPVFNIDTRIVDENGQDVKLGEIGEIIYQGPTLLKEYYKNPGANERAFKNGWFYSGDMVRKDEEGYIYIVGRKKDIIISGGENISAVEIEEVLGTHPKVREVAVVGVPDERWGETVKAFIVLGAGESLTEEQLTAYCKERMAGFKIPRYYSFLNELPHTATGKIEKYKLTQVPHIFVNRGPIPSH